MVRPPDPRTPRGGDRTDEPVTRRRNRSDRLLDRLRPLRRGFSRIETAAIARFGRSPISMLFRTPVLVLHTMGHRSGLERATALAYARPDEMEPSRGPAPKKEGPTSNGTPKLEMVWIVGGASGQRRLPDWVANVRADDRVGVTIDGRRRHGRAVEVHGPERERVWKELVLVWPRIDRYQVRAGRPVPVFRLRIDSDQDVAGGS